MTIAELLTIISFFNQTSYGLITNIMFYGLNVYLFWISFVETATLAVMVILFLYEEFLFWAHRAWGQNLDDESIPHEGSWKIIYQQSWKGISYSIYRDSLTILSSRRTHYLVFQLTKAKKYNKSMILSNKKYQFQEIKNSKSYKQEKPILSTGIKHSFIWFLKFPHILVETILSPLWKEMNHEWWKCTSFKRSLNKRLSRKQKVKDWMIFRYNKG